MKRSSSPSEGEERVEQFMARGVPGSPLALPCRHHRSAQNLSNPWELLHGDILRMETGPLSLPL